MLWRAVHHTEVCKIWQRDGTMASFTIQASKQLVRLPAPLSGKVCLDLFVHLPKLLIPRGLLCCYVRALDRHRSSQEGHAGVQGVQVHCMNVCMCSLAYPQSSTFILLFSQLEDRSGIFLSNKTRNDHQVMLVMPHPTFSSRTPGAT